MSKGNLFASVEWNGKTLYVYGYMPALELKKIVDDFQDGVEVEHEQVEIVEGRFVSPRLLEIVERGELGIRN